MVKAKYALQTIALSLAPTYILDYANCLSLGRRIGVCVLEHKVQYHYYMCLLVFVLKSGSCHIPLQI